MEFKGFNPPDRRLVQRAGLTLIETLTILAIVGLLVALLLPATHKAREMARRSICSGHLRQLGLALSSYEASFRTFPAGSNGLGYSLHVMLLPHIEQRPLFNSINFDLRADDIDTFSPNNTAYVQRVSVFVCPSEQLRDGMSGTSYAGNRGVGERLLANSGAFTSRRGRPFGLSAFTDGTSATAAMSEWVTGPVSLDVKDAKGSVFNTPRPLDGPAAFELFVEECHSLDVSNAAINNNDKGVNWMLGGYRHTLYNHTLPINDHSCVSSGLALEGAYSASSRHTDGAHTLFADGHVRFQKETLALPVWRAQGTRGGGEVFSP